MTIEPYRVVTIENWPAKNETLVSGTENSFKTSSSAIEKTEATHWRKTMIIVTIKQRIMMIGGVKNGAVHFYFRWFLIAMDPTIKK